MQSLLLKLSGEALGGQSGFGIDPEVLEKMCADVAELVTAGVGVAIVLGGGNVFRGKTLAERGLDRVVGDRMGMLATVMNGLALADFLTKNQTPNQLFSALPIPSLVQGYGRDSVRQALDAGKVAVLCGGTGNPYFTTDTAACLRGIELGVDTIVKATNIDGVYDDDPRTNPTAKRYDVVTYDEVLAKELGVMDLTAIVLCKEQNMPLVVCDVTEPGVLTRIAAGEAAGTRVVAAL